MKKRIRKKLQRGEFRPVGVRGVVTEVEQQAILHWLSRQHGILAATATVPTFIGRIVNA